MEAPQITLQESLSLPHNELAPRSWKASLRLGFTARAWGTELADREHEGPLRVQKPFYPEGREVCHVYVLHPPGGLVQGDALRISVTVQENAHALLTTPAAGKVYRSNDGRAEQSVVATVQAQGVLEWFPQETIIFSGAKAALKTRINLSSSSKSLAWEIICLGRPAAGETFDAGSCWFQFELFKEGLPLFVERNHFEGGSDSLSAAWGLGGLAAMGTFVVHPANVESLELARSLCHDDEHGAICTVTLVQDTLICRSFAADAGLVRDRFVRVWQAIRPLCLGRPGHAPRIWAT
jgi:urease accessory protein